MIYSSLPFIFLFLPASLLIYHAAPKKIHNGVMMLLSMAFCASFSVKFLWFVMIYVLLNYIAGLIIEELRMKRQNSWAAAPLSGMVFADILLLMTYRSEHMAWLRSGLKLDRAFFPVGISFMTLSAIGYLLDIYRRRQKAERNIIRFSLYMMMFPRLIMGPPVRYRSFQKSLRNRNEGLDSIGLGFTVFVKGLAKKVICADMLYSLYSSVKSIEVQEVSAFTAWLGATAYLMCFYFTLSGFADMGTGLGYCFGFRLPQSFNYPLFSAKVRTFAAKWHIQLIQWFRRYVTKPLTELGNGSTMYRRIIYISAWGIAGLWYKPDPNGLLWGLMIGTAVIAEHGLGRLKLLKATGVIYTYLVTIICTVIFMGDSLMYSLRYLIAMAGGNGVILGDDFGYFFKSYIVIMLLGAYVSTSLFKNMMIRSGMSRVSRFVEKVSPVMITGLFLLCTVMISVTGSSGFILFRL